MHLVAIGGSNAGLCAARHPRELDPTADVTVVVADAYPNVGRGLLVDGARPTNHSADQPIAQIRSSGWDRSHRSRRAEAAMADHIYRVAEIVGSSPESLQQAIRNGVARAGQTLRNLEWFEVTEIRGQIDDGAVAHFQVGLKVGFRLEKAGPQ
jgi:flavin-binding protein dodecin